MVKLLVHRLVKLAYLNIFTYKNFLGSVSNTLIRSNINYLIEKY